MSEFDPSTNGHRVRAEALERRRGSGVLLLTLISAFTGLNMLVGAGVGALVGGLTDAGDTAPYIVALGAALGGAAGVVIGARVAHRFAGAGGTGGLKQLVAWGWLGLVCSVALAAFVTSPLTPIVAILLPGLFALAGDRYLLRRQLAQAGQLKPKKKLRDQESSD